MASLLLRVSHAALCDHCCLQVRDKSDMSNYRGITVGSVIAKLFAMMLDHRIAIWAILQLY